ncbi:zinc-binding alcohol dehydrogenase family protein [Pollutimonas bauzanensis]|uniref:Zinc-type alcohol dehydrogenase-like protein n=1 Tax=Pollutimonas bauzanensis TaxID=658167 RepID=A0A1M5ZZE7_9BURK|nr:zinc-binding alcohol dehydrogenase family protein [Pollutimonas bauzanensis]SHI29283.1 zinc-binding alcohol dehydrogenase family protein [Pollutimonas bauzanensis]
MKAVGYTTYLPVEDERSLIDLELPIPAPGARDLLVRVQAVSVNPRDIKSRKTLPAAPGAPMVIGYDASGIVEKTGPGATLFQPGDEVFYAGVLNRPGSNAEFQLVDERIVGRKPATLDHATAASLPLTALTAYEMLFDRLAVERHAAAPRSLLILGGAGGVPSMAIQLARHAGLTVVATAARAESEKWVRELGAQHVVDHSRPLAEQIRRLGIGDIDYVFSTHTNAAVWSEIAKIIAPQGRFGLIDDPEPLDLRVFKAKSVSIHWEAMFTRPMLQTRDMIRQHEILTEIAGLVDTGVIRATATQNLGAINAANLRKAHALIESGKTIGKIVLAGF